MDGFTNVAAAGGETVYENIKSGKLTSATSVTFEFKEVDIIVNDSTYDLTVTFKNMSGGTGGTFILKSGESVNDMNYHGSGFSLSGTSVNCRYILLG